MTTHAPSTPAPPEVWHARRAERELEAAVLGGVAGGLGRHLAWPVLWVRVGFIVATVLGGFGLFLFLGLWMTLPAASAVSADQRLAPGLASAARGGRRPRARRRLSDLGPVIVLGALAIGAIFGVQAIFGSGAIVWPVALGVAGVALLWRQADEAQRERWFDLDGRLDPVQIVFGRGGWAAYARVGAGVTLVAIALFAFGLDDGSWQDARGALVAGLLGILGIGVVIGPWIWRLVGELTDERAERVRTQERADVAAHLHDSVLQTLALIQKNAADASTVARLARAQERDLRSWLYAGETADGSTVASALRAVAADTEDVHGVSVDVVTVGDCDVEEALRPIIAAARESLTNAAKHGGVTRIDLYAEISPDAVDIYVRDRGAGFDLDAVPEDRYGVRNSILDRMRRHGGSGEVRSAPGEGTEVRLHLRRPVPEREGMPDDRPDDRGAAAPDPESV
ncbi:sensor histidine kinase [Nocardioides sp. R-C-SC26]|uniref:sensor histidine kinase n=1 Tax=Nocardioides sp. R-C-SC26 TaxID=2870414 RepID=UPI001E4F5FBD|nr:PspC domain-containing protein [Nocardioides sp. R-C-SC26]